VAISPDGGRVYVTSAVSGDMSVIDTTTYTVSTVQVSSDATISGIAITPRGTRIYIGKSNGSVAVLDAATNAVIASVAVGEQPLGLDVDHSGASVYVVNHRSNSVSVIDAVTNTVHTTIAVGNSPIALGKFVGPQVCR
jgi:YVTN family beta-propeller protein